MMSTHCDFNPAIDSRWFTEKDGKVFLFKIQGNFCRGFKESFEITSYLLKYRHKEDLQIIPAEDLRKLIAQGVVKPDWSPEGLLLDKPEEMN